MTEFDPGAGWREWFGGEEWSDAERIVHVGGAVARRIWLREEPMPPLPVEPYTVIRATTRSGTTVAAALWPHAGWRLWGGDLADLSDITGFEVRAEPRREPFQWEKPDVIAERVRRETAKAVLDRLRSEKGWTHSDIRVLNEVAREFGVDDV